MQTEGASAVGVNSEEMRIVGEGRAEVRGRGVWKRDVQSGGRM